MQTLQGWRSLFMPEGHLPAAGSRLSNPALARTLQAVAQGGAADFYGGDVGRSLAQFAKENGGFFTPADLAAQQARWGEPLSGSYRDMTLFETPAPTQGFTVLQMLKMVEPFELHKMDLLDPKRIHLMVQAKQISYHDRDRWLGDPSYTDVPMDMLLSDMYLNVYQHDLSLSIQALFSFRSRASHVPPFLSAKRKQNSFLDSHPCKSLRAPHIIISKSSTCVKPTLQNL